MVLSEEFWAEVKKSVSRYAAKDKDPYEAIAEIGAAKLAGKKLKLTSRIQKFWDDYWKGPELPLGVLPS